MPRVLEKSQVSATAAPNKELRRTKDSHLPFLLVCVAFLAIGAGISLTGEFPINDDYIYTWSVRHLLETGQFKIPGTVASSIFPIYSGAGICALAGGFSYGILRVLSFIFGLAGGLGLYLALRQIGLRNRDAAIFSAVYLLNPLFVNVNFGFMTDVPALALNNWFLYFGLRLAKVRSAGKGLDWSALCGAFVVVSLAVASRQTVLALLPAALVLACRPGLTAVARVAIVTALAIWPALFYKMLEPIVLGACDYLVSYNGYKQFFANVLLSLVKTPVAGFTVLFEQAAKVSSYIGLFCLPISIPMVISALFIRRSTLKFWLPAFVIVSGLIVLPVSGLLAKHCLMPMSENLFSPPAVGTYCILSGGVPGWSHGSKLGLTYFAALAASGLVSLLLLALLPLRRFFASTDASSGTSKVRVAAKFFRPLISIAPSTWFVTVAAVCSLGLLVVQTTVMNLDRYYLFALGPVLLLLALVWRKLGTARLRLVAAVFCTIMFVYSYITALDCMSFQRERWNALEYLVSCGVPPLTIDGGPEFNYGYNMRLCEGYRMDKEVFGWPDSWRGGHPRNQWRWWPISGEKYIVSGSKMEDYSVVRTFPYFSPLKWRNRDIYVLRANESIPH